MSVAIEAELRGFAKARQVFDRLSHRDTHDLLDTIGQQVENQTKGRISSGEMVGPDGIPWPDLSIDYERWKVRKKGWAVTMLRLEGHLLESIQHIVSGDEVEIGSNLVYAHANQETRPYLGISDENQDDLEETIVVWLKGIMRV